jgi:hypothetical protein
VAQPFSRISLWVQIKVFQGPYFSEALYSEVLVRVLKLMAKSSTSLRYLELLLFFIFGHHALAIGSEKSVRS